MNVVSKIVVGFAGIFTCMMVAHAEDLLPAKQFHFKDHAFGCISKEKFDAAYKHAKAGEQGKVDHLFDGYECMPTPTNTNYKVLQVIGQDVEFVNANNGDRQGMWTHRSFIKP